jgi:tetratricopeptide (TPR) repeat protein
MRKRRILSAAAIWLLAVGACQAFDSIKTTGSVKNTRTGRVMNVSPLNVEIKEIGDQMATVPANEISMIFYETDPATMKTAKMHILNNRYANAQTLLNEIKPADYKDEDKVPQQDLGYYQALCAAKLTGLGKGSVAEAAKMMKSFVDENPKSYHYFPALEILGDLSVAEGKYAEAAGYYAKLEDAPWPDYKLRAGVDAGRALLAQGKNREAEAAFDRVIASLAEGELAAPQRMAARLGKAAALTAEKKTDPAVRLIEEVLNTANPEDADMMSRAYNALGTAYRTSGKTKEALLAFLHVDMLYPAQAEAHAEALANLVDLWEEVHKNERANAARKTLEEQYKDSPWAKKVRERAEQSP